MNRRSILAGGGHIRSVSHYTIFAAGGRAWQIKDWIDRGFVSRYTDPESSGH